MQEGRAGMFPLSFPCCPRGTHVQFLLSAPPAAVDKRNILSSMEKALRYLTVTNSFVRLGYEGSSCDAAFAGGTPLPSSPKQIPELVKTQNKKTLPT